MVSCWKAVGTKQRILRPVPIRCLSKPRKAKADVTTHTIRVQLKKKGRHHIGINVAIAHSSTGQRDEYFRFCR